MLEFTGPFEKTNQVQITTRTWVAEAEGTIFNIVCLKLSDLENMRTGRVNFIGDTKPKFGTLEERTDVYLTNWAYVDAIGGRRIRPIVGRFNGGCATYKEAKALCEDVFKIRDRFLISKPMNGVKPHA